MDTRIAITLGKRQLVDSIWKAAGIEGLGTTFPDTEKILDNLPVETRSSEVFFIVNMKHAWNFLFDNIDYPNNFSVLCELDRICMDNLGYGGGMVRKVPVSIGGISWSPLIPDEITVKEEFHAIIENIEASALPVQKVNYILDLFCYLCRTQIFIDGNIYIAQLMTNKLLMQYDLGILSVPYDRIDEFKRMLVRFYESGDNWEFKQFLFQTSWLPTDTKWLMQESELVEGSYEPYQINIFYEELESK